MPEHMGLSERSCRRTVSRLAGWANRDRRGWVGVAEEAGFRLDREDRGSYSEWRINTRDGDTIGILHEFPDEVFGFAFTGWPVRWWRCLLKGRR